MTKLLRVFVRFIAIGALAGGLSLLLKAEPSLYWLLVAVGIASAILLMVCLVLAHKRISDARGNLRSKYGSRPAGCLHIPPRYWRRPDPFIYSQTYLQGLGLEVTWDNPDIWLERAGVIIHDNLEPSTDYDIVVRVHNASVETPAFDVAVTFETLDYGAGALPIPIGATRIPIIPVQGNPTPTTRLPWTSPAKGGHVCIRVRLHCVDDANPLNNMGQKNLHVITADELLAQKYIAFPLHNPTGKAVKLRFVASVYRPTRPIAQEAMRDTAIRSRLPTLWIMSRSRPRWRMTDMELRDLVARQLAEVKLHNSSGGFPVPADWGLQLPEQVIILEQQSVELKVPIALANIGESININAITSDGVLYGGVTTNVVREHLNG